ncbi:MurR/RpiR family transcriptional regulator [Thaumasiovibrio subtropicus]|uniref:MurR/RpiR family transcriptional regulator n=1 Tax=Thaumasiovibrio subtropicus TaxID=1891207 RepID=UPI000B350608|nr:MurR/RpiR family transcriptional regulator [Thaumasiovibrio subtropicus]
MSEIANKVTALMETGSPTERKLSRLIVERHFDITDLSAKALGDMCDASNASVVRYARSLGCSGYSELKMALYGKKDQPVDSSELYQTLDKADSTPELIAKSKSLFTSGIERSLDLIDPDVLDLCAEKIIRSGKVVLIGIGASALVAAEINHKLIRIGINVQFNVDYHSQLVHASLMKADDVAIIISARGNTKEAIMALESAKEAGASVIALTRYGKDKISQMADWVIPYFYNEQHSQLGIVTPQLMQSVVFDVLFFKITAMMGDDVAHPLSKAISTVSRTQS